MLIIDLIKLMRPKHWIKNGLIVVPLVFGGGLFNPLLLVQVFWSIVIFSLVASIVYVINDIRDVKKDRKHPKKKYRPIASGAVSVKQAVALVVVLAAVSIVIGVIVDLSVFSWILLGVYLAINIGYSFGLKNYPIVDVAILAAGFVIRMYYGGDVVGIEVSSWLYMTVLAGALYLGLGKRRNEILTNGTKSRKVNESYTLGFLDKNMYVSLGLLLVFYSLWATDPARDNPFLYVTIPLLILVFMSYSLSIEKGSSSGDPVDVLSSSKLLIGLALLYVIATVTIVYI